MRLDRVQPDAGDEVREQDVASMVAPVAIPAAFGPVSGRPPARWVVSTGSRPRHEARRPTPSDAGDDDRPAGSPQRADAPRSAGTRRPPPRDDGVRASGSRSGWTGPAARPGSRDRRPHVIRGRRRAEDERALRDRTEQGGVVEALVGDAIAARGRHAVADEQDGLAVEQRVRDAVHRAGRARTAGDDAGARAAGELGRGRGHEHRRGLGVGEDEAQSLGLRRPDDVEVAAAARQAEEDLDTRVTQAGGDELRDRPAHRTPLSAARAIRSLRSSSSRSAAVAEERPPTPPASAP
jgi:hypothetical protein